MPPVDSYCEPVAGSVQCFPELPTPRPRSVELALPERPVLVAYDEFLALGDPRVAEASQALLDRAGGTAGRPPDPRLERGGPAVTDRDRVQPRPKRRVGQVRRGRRVGLVPEDVPAGPYWYGYSVGKWDGDTLIVQTLGLDERAWMDEWGTIFSGEARIEERWKRTAADKMELTITVHDPITFTKAWTSDAKVYTLQPKEEVLEMIFAPMDEQEFNQRIRNPAAGITKP